MGCAEAGREDAAALGMALGFRVPTFLVVLLCFCQAWHGRQNLNQAVPPLLLVANLDSTAAANKYVSPSDTD